MANELFYSGDTGDTVMALIKRANTRWNGSGMVVNAAISDAQWTTGMVTLTELLTDNDTPTGDYVGDFPAGITTAGDYIVEYLVTASPTPGMRGSKTDLILWDGTQKIELVTASLEGVKIESSISASSALVNDSGTQLTKINARQALSLALSALAGIISGADGSTLSFKAGGKGTTRITAETDSTGRTSLVLTVPD